MNNKNYILVSMEDDRARKIATVLGNKTCKKILDVLSEKDCSEKDIADNLKIPINTVEYNLKKLLHAELIEKTKGFFWSKKGKKIPMYTISNKSIIISPRKKISSSIKTILPVVLISGIATLLLRKLTQFPVRTGEYAMKATLDTEIALASSASDTGTFFAQSVTPAAWFFIGSCFAIIIFVLLSLRKIVKGGND